MLCARQGRWCADASKDVVRGVGGLVALVRAAAYCFNASRPAAGGAA